MKVALYREYLLLKGDRKLKDILIYFLVYFGMVLALLSFIKSSGSIAFIFAFMTGILSNIYNIDDKNGTLAVLRTMPIKSYKYVIARYITIIIAYLIIIFLFIFAHKIATVFFGINMLNDFYKSINIVMIAIFILTMFHVPGYFAFGAKGMAILLYLFLVTTIVIGLVLGLYFGFLSKLEYINNYFVFAIILCLVSALLSILVSNTIVKNKDL